MCSFRGRNSVGGKFVINSAGDLDVLKLFCERAQLSAISKHQLEEGKAGKHRGELEIDLEYAFFGTGDPALCVHPRAYAPLCSMRGSMPSYFYVFQ
jgi:hypothetical protein